MDFEGCDLCKEYETIFIKPDEYKIIENGHILVKKTALQREGAATIWGT